ncbi:hypothetical protein E2562_018746 [Oryza meyeriana var. granulata]|uniref:Uncharacterized protein n=1 Tax=Oryza meyeriana var. granulata TaxID=110450 RepID=A0A6G1EMV1_9ORYZ|nr:hypothetical protein E2562_018746 [Oryza meyeriana var. granulata]
MSLSTYQEPCSCCWKVTVLPGSFTPPLGGRDPAGKLRRPLAPIPAAWSPSRSVSPGASPATTALPCWAANGVLAACIGFSSGRWRK